jgi:hypothetical protein
MKKFSCRTTWNFHFTWRETFMFWALTEKFHVRPHESFMSHNMKLLWQLRYLKVPCYLTQFFLLCTVPAQKELDWAIRTPIQIHNVHILDTTIGDFRNEKCHAHHSCDYIVALPLSISKQPTMASMAFSISLKLSIDNEESQ